eukprot:1780622-Rhodomonas_salina.2
MTWSRDPWSRHTRTNLVTSQTCDVIMATWRSNCCLSSSTSSLSALSDSPAVISAPIPRRRKTPGFSRQFVLETWKISLEFAPQPPLHDSLPSRCVPQNTLSLRALWTTAKRPFHASAVSSIAIITCDARLGLQSQLHLRPVHPATQSRPLILRSRPLIPPGHVRPCPPGHVHPDPALILRSRPPLSAGHVPLFAKRKRKRRANLSGFCSRS